MQMLSLIDRWAEDENGFAVLGESEKTTNGGKGSGNFGHAGRLGEVGGSSDKNTPNPLGSKYRKIIDNFDTSNFTDEEKELIRAYYIAYAIGNSNFKNEQELPERMWLVPKEEFFDREDFTVDSKTYYEQAKEFLKKYSQSSYDKKDIEWRKMIAEGYVVKYVEAAEAVDENKASFLFNLPEARKLVNGDIQVINLLKYLTEDTTTRFTDMSDETLRKLIKPYEYASDFMPRMFESEIKGRKLDKTINEKGISFDKDIVVVRRVPTKEKIDRQIEEQGFYQQEGFTSTSAGKNIARKTPGGHILGDNLYKITIPAGTKVLPIEPFLDEYSSDLRNQRELLLPQKTRFIRADNGTDLIALTKTYREKNNG